MADTITLAIDALASAAFIEGGVSIERTDEARKFTEQRKRELIEAIAAGQLQAVAAQAPAAVAAHELDQYLCQAWGETDLPAVAIVGGLDAVRQFLIDHWLGSPDHQADDGTNMLEEAMVGMQEEWDLEGNAWKWQAQFEIGGVSVQRVDNFSPALPATEDSSAGDLAEVQAEPVAWINGESLRAVIECPKSSIQRVWLKAKRSAENDTPLYTAPQAQPADAPNEWEEIGSLPTCDDLIWLYCQDTNTIDGPVAPHPMYEDSWTHWAYAEAPSTATIDAAMAVAQEGGNAAKEA